VRAKFFKVVRKIKSRDKVPRNATEDERQSQIRQLCFTKKKIPVAE